MGNRPQAGKDNANLPPSYTAGGGANEDTEMKATDPEKKPVDLPIRSGRGAGGRGCGAGRGGAGPRGGIRGGGCGGPRGRGRGRGRGLGHCRCRCRGHGIQHHAHMASHHHRGNNSPGLDLPALLGDLGSPLGLNYNGSSENGNEAEQKGPNGFVPHVDIFDMPVRYMVHVSLPGAKKQNIQVDYMPAISVLHISGTVNRPPEVQQEQMDGLVVDGREREIGPFEKEIHLGTRLNPADIAVDDISSKLEDGVLIVFLPKKAVDPSVLKKRISIEEPKREDKEGEKTDNARDKKADVMTYKGPGGRAILYDYNEGPVANRETERVKGEKKDDVSDKKADGMFYNLPDPFPYKWAGSMPYKQADILPFKGPDGMAYKQENSMFYNLPDVTLYKRADGRLASKYKKMPVATEAESMMAYKRGDGRTNYQRQDDRIEFEETPVADSETKAEKASNAKEDDLLLQGDYSRSDSDEKEYVNVSMK